MIGITAYGGYVPRLRLSRKAAVEANSWFNPALKAYQKGERAICNWDEDSLTMGVEAARDCLRGEAPDGLNAVYMASTTMPFQDRQNANVLGTALSLGENLMTMDVTSSQRAGTTAMLNAFRGLGGGTTLLVASEKRRTKAAGTQELLYGDGAAAFLLGSEAVLAEYIGGHQLATDFVDHYRGANEEFDYNWEERWIRDEGYMKIVPRALEAAFAAVGITAGDVDHFIMPAVIRNIGGLVSRRVGLPAEAVRDNLQATMGESGTAHSMVMLSLCLQEAEPGQTIVVVGWGQGCDVLVFRTTDAVKSYAPGYGIKGYLARRKEETNYNRYLAFNNLVTQDKGLRAEVDKQTALTTLYRKKEMLLGFVGGKCRQCGTVQYPKTNVCVSPNCGAFHSQDDHPFSEVPATVQSWTADNLTFSPDPPQHFGMVVFEEGGRLMADLTDVDVGHVEVDMPLRMMFRVKAYDEQRGFTQYFWKAAPALPEQA